MKNFDHHIETEILFGEGKIKGFGKKIAAVTDSVLLCYGGGSIKKNGVYDAAVAELKANGVRYEELSGIDPNPRIESVRAGIALVKKHRLGGVLAVGGGSVIDCAKAIAGGAATPHEDAWDLVVSSAFTAALPVFSVLTLSATGSEMDAFAVITNFETNEKLGCVVARPVCSVLDPSYTFTVPAHQTAAGSADILSHIFESYFSKVRTAYVQDRFAEALLKTVIRYAPVAMEKPDDYEARANLMWASSLAINDLIKEGKGEDWTVHGIEHELSAFYDITHGVGLAILTPRWMRYVLSEETLWRFRMYGVNVWGIDASLPDSEIAERAIGMTETLLFETLRIPSTLTEIGIGRENFERMAEKVAIPVPDNRFVPLTAKDVVNILEKCL